MINKHASTNWSRVRPGIWLLFSLLITASLIGSGTVISGQAQDIVNDDQSTLALPDNIFGVEMVSFTDVHGKAKVVEANTSWVRLNGVLWSDIDTDGSGNYDWTKMSALESQLADAKNNHNIEVIMVVRSTPTYAQRDGLFCGPIKEINFKEFANFLSALVTRYKAQVKYWEIWNEPDAAKDSALNAGYYGCWGDPSDTTYYGGTYFSQMLSQAYTAIKNADSQAQVIVGGLMMDCGPNYSGTACDKNKLKFLEGILNHGKGVNFDGIAFHSFDYFPGGLGNYENTNWNSSRISTGPVGLLKVDYIRGLLAKHGVVGKYLINSEMALLWNNTGNLSQFETTKQYYVVQSYASSLARNLRVAVWYGARMGWRESDLLTLADPPAARIAYNAFKFGRTELAGAVYIKDITQYSGVMGYEFLRGDRRVWVLWSKDGSNHTITLPEFPLAIFDSDGDSKSLANSITITLEPYYIEMNPSFYLYTPLVSMNNQAIKNGGFDRGLDGYGNPVQWTFTQGDASLGKGLITSNPSVPYLDTSIPVGAASVILGSFEYACQGGVPVGFSGVQQAFLVPSSLGGNKVKLAFNYIIYSQDKSAGDNYDWFEVHIIETSTGDRMIYRDGNTTNTYGCSAPWNRVPAGAGWKTAIVDLTSPVDYRGKTVTLEFRTYNRLDGYYNTVSYVDQVMIDFGP